MKESKVCTRCKQEKPISEFRKDKTRVDNLCCWCINCMVSVNSKQLAELKEDILTHYGNGKCACVRCGFDDIKALSIDHINGGGYRHRKDIGMSGNKFFRWLKKEGYPEGYQTLCMNCQFITYNDRIAPARKPFTHISQEKYPREYKLIDESQPSNYERDTVILPVRIKKILLAEVEQRVTKKKVSRNSWMNWVIIQGLRSHKRQRKGGKDNGTNQRHTET